VIVELDRFPYYKNDGHLEMPGLHIAIRRGDRAEVLRRLKPFNGMSYCDGPGWMPVHIAVLAPTNPDRYRILEDVLRCTMCLGTPDASGRTALDLAIEAGDTQAADLLRAAEARSKTNELGI
jgi:ankyrin repeat protein